MFSLDEIKKYPVNWTDGMRVSAKDFATTDEAWNDAMRDVRVSLLQGIQFGLLPSLRDSSDKSMYPKFALDGNRNELTLLECRAITEGGYRVEITEDLHKKLSVPAKLPSVSITFKEDFEAYITVNLFKQQPSGTISGDAPARYQFLTPLYELSILPKSEGMGLSGMNHLKIAEFKWNGKGFTQDNTYLPPCMIISASAVLQERHDKSGALLKQIHDNCLQLVKQYRMDNRPDVRDATNWIEKLIAHISGNLWTFVELLPQKTPFESIVYAKNFAQFVLSTAEVHEANPYMRDSLKTQRPLFKALADPHFNCDDLHTAFTRIDAALVGLYRWLKALYESFKVGRVIDVREIK
jgi:hypothetical protein